MLARLIILAIYILTFIFFIIVGLVCVKYHSKFPDTKVGYHVLWAMKSSELWTAANKLSGYLCIIFGIVGFLILPLVFYLFDLNKNIQLAVYFLETIIFTVLIIYLPKKIVKNQYPNFFED